MNRQNGRSGGNWRALVPIAVFLVLYIGSGVALDSFYAMSFLPYLYYPYLMAVSAVCFILFIGGREIKR